MLEVIKNILDIAIISVAIYLLLDYIRNKQAFFVLIGILILGLLTYISKIADLNVTYKLLSNFWGSIIIILAIVFQNEIKSGLANIGLKTIKVAHPVLYRELTDAIEELRNEKTGALIVIKREVGLEEYIETGVILNAKISKELLKSIFTKNSPLHDGAVIIENGVIKAAKCILPLSSIDIPKKFGTRHLACLGVTQVSDALAVAVSEETGNIMLAKKGEYFIFEKMDEFEKKLSEFIL